jgi:hypothetical protein
MCFSQPSSAFLAQEWPNGGSASSWRELFGWLVGGKLAADEQQPFANMYSAREVL